jgi:hypothetical protein
MTSRASAAVAVHQHYLTYGLYPIGAYAVIGPELVDRIYEGSFVPELWPSVLDKLAQIGDAGGGTFFVANTKVVSWTSSAIVRDGMEIFAKSDIVARGQRTTA